MPQRFLRPGITTSDAWNAVSFEAQSLYIRILTLVDDWGRYDARVPILHGQCFALRPDVKPQRTAGLRSELHNAGLLEVYEVGGKEFLQITRWTERARGEKSKYPNPPPVTERSDIPQVSAGNGSGAQRKDASLATASSPLHPLPSTIASCPAIPAPAGENKSRGTESEISEFCKSLGLPQTDGESCFHKWEGNGWKNGTAPIKCWRSTVRSWKAAGYLPSQKNGLSKACIREHIQPKTVIRI